MNESLKRIVCLVLIIIFALIFLICFFGIVACQGRLLSLNVNSTCFDIYSKGDNGQFRKSIHNIVPLEILCALVICFCQLICICFLAYSLTSFRKRHYFSIVKERFCYVFIWLFTLTLFATPTRYWIELGVVEWSDFCEDFQTLFIFYLLALIFAFVSYGVGCFANWDIMFERNDLKNSSFVKPIYSLENSGTPDFYSNLPRSGQYVSPFVNPEISINVAHRQTLGRSTAAAISPPSLQTFSGSTPLSFPDVFYDRKSAPVNAVVVENNEPTEKEETSSSGDTNSNH